MRFADMGMDFPLFRAPVEDAEVDPAGPCVVCGTPATVRFREACYACFRADKVWNAFETELGLVCTEDAARGVTREVPKLLDPRRLAEHGVAPSLEPGTLGVKVLASELHELLRTPSFITWQGATWYFCCQRAMTFLGKLPSPDVDIEAVFGVSAKEAAVIRPAIASGALWTYAFSCRACGRMRAYGDSD